MRIFNKAGQVTLTAAALGMMSMAAYAVPTTIPDMEEASDAPNSPVAQVQIDDNAVVRDTVDPTPVVATASAYGDPTLEEGAVGQVIGVHMQGAYIGDSTPNVNSAD